MSAIYYDIEQGSDIWHEARRGIVSASCFHKLITPTGKPATGEKPKTYLAELIAERIEPSESFSSEWAERGLALEPDAVSAFEFITDMEVLPMGIVYKDASYAASCSPDGLIGETSGLEIKSLKLSNHIKHLLAGTVPPEHVMQCHASMWITGRDSWYFISYHPAAKALIKCVDRDEKIMSTMDRVIPEFIEILNKSAAFVIGYEHQTNQQLLEEAA